MLLEDRVGPTLAALRPLKPAQTESFPVMADLHGRCPLDDWPRLHTELHTTLDSIWSLSTARMDRPRDAERQRHQDNQQRLQVLLATARQHFDPAVEWDQFRETLWSGRDTVNGAAGRRGLRASAFFCPGPNQDPRRACDALDAVDRA